MTRKPTPVPVNLALQGGGSHGAFTWGVLDRLLEEPGIVIDGISGTSAGAMNAAILASGFLHGGPAGARHAARCNEHGAPRPGAAALARLRPHLGGGEAAPGLRQGG